MNFDKEHQPEGFYLDHDVVQAEIWNEIEHWLETGFFRVYKDDTLRGIGHRDFDKVEYQIPWQIGGEGRQVAQFGFLYDYEKAIVDDFTQSVPEIPAPLRELLLENLNLESFGNSFTDRNIRFTQCIINKYEEDTTIAWHKDHEDFGPIILVYTFGEERPLNMRFPINASSMDKIAMQTIESDDENSHYIHFSASPRHGSRYILSGPSRDIWEHCVPSGHGRRFSFTFRTKLEIKSNI